MRTRLNNDIDNIQPWHYSAFEWNQFGPQSTKYEKMGAVRISEACPVYNCHGLTFANRRTQVEEAGEMTVAKILNDDGYQEVPEAQTKTGDVVVYYNDQGQVEHSGLVVGRIVGSGLNVPEIWSKWGKGYEWRHPLRICPWNSMATKFYRMVKWKYEEVFKANL